MSDQKKIIYLKKAGRGGGGNKRIILLATILVFVVSAIWLTVFIVDKFMPNREVIPPDEYYEDWSENFIVDGGEQRTGFMSLEMNGEIYIPFEFVKERVDKYAFWDAPEKRLTLTTADSVTRFSATGNEYYEDDTRVELEHPLYITDGNLYIPAGFLAERYDMEINKSQEYGVVIVENTYLERSYTHVISKKTALRYDSDKKSPIAENLNKDDRLTVFEEDGEYTKARSENGIIGYVKTSDINGSVIVAPPPRPEPVITYTKPLTGKITLLWDQVTTVQANSEPLRRQTINGVDVLSPTWFSFDNNKLNGDIISVADKGYVEYAHANNYQVWALITDNFSRDVSHAVVSSTAVREHVINQLLKHVDTYKLDGINIDFEAVGKEDAAAYLQFIRELAPALHKRGAYLSVDMFVPSPWSMYYNRAEVGKAADFICIMTYDEHYSGSPTSGPVASLNFVDSGVADTLEEVPKEKILMGMPFYVRVWREERDDPDSAPNVTSTAYAMETARRIFENNNAEFLWLEETGCYYAEYQATENGKQVAYKVWLEDEYSIEQKLKVVEKYDVAGVACWKRGLEKQDIWAMINNYVN